MRTLPMRTLSNTGLQAGVSARSGHQPFQRLTLPGMLRVSRSGEHARAILGLTSSSVATADFAPVLGELLGFADSKAKSQMGCLADQIWSPVGGPAGEQNITALQTPSTREN